MMRVKRHGCAVLFCLLVGGSISAQDPRVPGGQTIPDLYQDFRGGKPLLPGVKLAGPKMGVIKPEDGGLRITLPADRKSPKDAFGVLAVVHLSGDFEITGGYEILSADPRQKGPGAGVSLTLKHNQKSPNWHRVSHYLRINEGDVYLAGRDAAGGLRMEPAVGRTGQLRLARRGAVLHYLVADEPGGVFRELTQEEFGGDDVEVVRLVVATNGSPTALDARLLDLRIRFGKTTPIVPPTVAVAPPAAPPQAGDRGSLIMEVVLGLATALAGVVGLAAWLFVRKRRGSADEAAPLSFSCPECQRILKTQTEMVGKKVKCAQCGTAILVPSLTRSA